MPWKFPVVQGVGRCLWGSALPCAEHSFPHTLFFSSQRLCGHSVTFRSPSFAFSCMQSIPALWSVARSVLLPCCFWGVVEPGLCFPNKAFLAKPSLLGSLKDFGRLLGIISEEAQWGEGKTTGSSVPSADISLRRGIWTTGPAPSLPSIGGRWSL